VNLTAPAYTVEEERKKALFKPGQSCEPELLVATLFFRTTVSHLRVRSVARREINIRKKISGTYDLNRSCSLPQLSAETASCRV
jgi:hypothetical protein